MVMKLLQLHNLVLVLYSKVIVMQVGKILGTLVLLIEISRTSIEVDLVPYRVVKIVLIEFHEDVYYKNIVNRRTKIKQSHY